MAEILTTLTLIFVMASISLAVLNRFSHPAVPAYILAGLVLSFFVPEDSLISLAQLGIVFLVFVFGVKFDPTRLKSVARDGQIVAFEQLAAIGALALISAQWMGFTVVESIYFALFAATSSSLVGLRLIEDEVQIDLIHGRLAESIHLIQDLMAIGVIVVLTSPSFKFGSIFWSLAAALSLLFVGLIFRNYLFVYFSKLVGDSQELIMISSLAVLSLFLAISQLIGLNFVVGAFAAGLSFARFPENMEILDTTGSLKDFFSAVFFISLGTLVSIPGAQALVVAALLIFFTSILKPAITAFSLQSRGIDDRTAHLTGFSLDQVSEFSLILGITAHLIGSIPAHLFEGLILAAVTTMIISAYTNRHEEALYNLMASIKFLPAFKKIKDSSDLEDIDEHVILIGYDLQGKVLSQKLEEEGQEFIIIENDPEKIEKIKEEEYSYIYGDVMASGPWEKARVKNAKLVISTVPVEKVSRRILSVETDADKVLRAKDAQTAERLLEKGATYVSVPELIGSEMLGDHVKAVMNDRDYREELRRKNLLKIREEQRQ